MKRIIITLSAVCVVALGFNSCSKDAFGDKYLNPAKVTTTSVDKLFTGVLSRAGDFQRIAYGRYMCTDQDLGIMAQTWGCTRGNMYGSGVYGFDEQWNRYIAVVTQTKVMVSEWEKLGEAAKAQMKPYVLCGQAVMYQAMLQTLDLIGKLAYNDVGGYITTGEMSFAKLDDPKELYRLILSDLARINNDLQSESDFASNTDWLNEGKISKWRVYANSLRLRAAIRLTGAEDYTNPANDMKDEAIAIVKEILGDPTTYPVVTGVDDQIFISNRNQSGNGWWSTMTGFDNYAQWHRRNTASAAMIEKMDFNRDSLYNEGDDPRLKLLYDPIQGGVWKGKYVGVNTRTKAPEQSQILSGSIPGGENIRQYSFYNERSYRENRNMISYVITPSEIALYKAEACLRGWIAGGEAAAKDEYVRAVKESIKMYMRTNQESSAASSEVMTRSPLIPEIEAKTWNDAYLENFANTRWNAEANKFKAVYEEFWRHCSIHNVVETWNVLRRTGYPNDLYYPFCPSNSQKVLPQRLILPVSEHQKNANIPDESVSTGYEAGKSYWEVLFWARLIQGETTED